MTDLHLIRVPMDMRPLSSWARERGLAGGRMGGCFDEGRALHHLLVEAFGRGVIRSFRLLVAPPGTTGNVYAYSESDAGRLGELARTFAMPDHLRVLRIDLLEGKKMPGDWRAGQKLGFDLRVRPVRRLRRETVTKNGATYSKGAELDAFLVDMLHRPTSRGVVDCTRKAVYLDWMDRHLAGAAILDRKASRLAQFRRTRVCRGQRSIAGPDATIHGSLTVADPTGFAGLLWRGIGRHRAYGFGMLLLRPPDRRVREQHLHPKAQSHIP